jgi:membrane fusion protein (multidrug efflux system)
MRLAGEEETRTRALFAAGAASESEVARAVAEHREKTAALDALVHQTQALDAVGRQRESSRKIRREQLERQHAQLEADLAYARAEVERLENELERKVIRAPVDGTLGEVASLQPGAVLAEGSVVATLIPRGELQVVAGYGADSIGRITSGQRGRLRLDGFPWTQYGTVALEVVRVASEIREQSIRVEFRIRESSIPLHHGMTGTVDVEVEQVSPLVLMLRAAGKRVDESRN